MTWAIEFYPLGAAYLGLAVPAFIFHVLFWVQVAMHRSLRQISMLWVYNYLFTDLILLIQLFLEYIFRTSLSYCISPFTFSILCNLEAYTAAYMTVLEAYMLVGLNVSRYFFIVKNYNLATQYPSLLILLMVFLYIFGLTIYILQVEVFHIIDVHKHDDTPSCHFQYINTKTGLGNLTCVLIIPIILNCYFMAITTIHVRRSQQAARAQVGKIEIPIFLNFEKIFSF